MTTDWNRHTSRVGIGDERWRRPGPGYGPPEEGLAPGDPRSPLEPVLYEVKKTIVGQDVLLSGC